MNLQNYLDENDLEYIHIGGAGECLYRAFSFRRFGKESRWPEIKQVEIDFLTNSSILTVDKMPKQDYIQMIRPQAYNGTDLDAYILAKIFKYRIPLYRVIGNQFSNDPYVEFGDRVVLDQALGFQTFDSFSSAILIVHVPGHYDLLVDALELGKQFYPQVETKEDGILFLKFHDLV